MINQPIKIAINSRSWIEANGIRIPLTTDELVSILEEYTEDCMGVLAQMLNEAESASTRRKYIRHNSYEDDFRDSHLER